MTESNKSLNISEIEPISPYYKFYIIGGILIIGLAIIFFLKISFFIPIYFLFHTEYIRVIGISLLLLFGFRLVSIGLKFLRERYKLRSILSFILFLLAFIPFIFILTSYHINLFYLDDGTILIWIFPLLSILSLIEGVLLLITSQQKIKKMLIYFQFIFSVIMSIPLIYLAYSCSIIVFM